jgi:hypothetical protein
MKEQIKPVELLVTKAKSEDVLHDIVRLDLTYRPFARAGRVIRIRHDSKSVLAIARGHPSENTSDISLDSELRRRLGLEANQRATFTFEKAGFWGEFIWAWSATNAVPRIAARLALLSLVLGIFGLVSGVISLFK